MRQEHTHNIDLSFLFFFFFFFFSFFFFFELVRSEILSAAANGEFSTEVNVSDPLYYDAVFQSLVLNALRSEGVQAEFAHGTFSLAWRK